MYSFDFQVLDLAILFCNRYCLCLCKQSWCASLWSFGMWCSRQSEFRPRICSWVHTSKFDMCSQTMIDQLYKWYLCVKSSTGLYASGWKAGTSLAWLQEVIKRLSWWSQWLLDIKDYTLFSNTLWFMSFPQVFLSSCLGCKFWTGSWPWGCCTNWRVINHKQFYPITFDSWNIFLLTNFSIKFFFDIIRIGGD